MRNISSALVAAMVLVAAACTGNPPTPAPDPRIGQLEELTNILSDDIERLSGQIGQLHATPAPVLTPTPGPTLEQIERVVEGTIATAVEELPTPAPRPTSEDVRRAVQEGIAAYDASRPTPTPGPSPAQIDALVEDRIGTAISRLPPPPTPGSTPAEIQGMIDDEIASAIAALPPAPTPGPSLDEIQGMVSKEVAEAVSRLPSVSIIPQTSASSWTALTDELTLSVRPGRPIAGRDVEFFLEGLEPWSRVEIEFVDPRNEPAEWVTDDEGHFTRENGDPVTKHTLYADGAGTLDWLRVATKDAEGVWTVRVDIDGVSHTVTYPVSQLQLSMEKVDTVGLEMRRYQGSVSDSYIASLVPASFAVDLQAHLDWVVRRLNEEYGLRSTQIPDIFLLGDRTNLEIISRATGREVGFEAGFYRNTGPRPGIYMTTDEYRTGVQRLLTHEYVHLLVDELARGPETPAWLNEGLAEYLEAKLGLESERPSVTRLLVYRQMDRVQQSHAAGLGLSLPGLESPLSWSQQTDENRIRLQYGTAHMAVKYMIEELSAEGPIEIMRRMGGGASLPEALRDVLGTSYAEFQQRFGAWVSTWTDPEREEMRGYVERMNSIYNAVDEHVDRRNESLGDSQGQSQRAAILHEVTAALLDIYQDLLTVTYPESVKALHDEFDAYVGTIVDWLALERDYAATGRDSKRTEANDMLPEVNARGARAWRSLNNLQYVYQVGRY